MRASAAFSRLLRLPGVWVRRVESTASAVVVTVVLLRHRLRHPLCSFETLSAHDTRPGKSRWCHLDLGTWKLELQAGLRRLTYSGHDDRTEGVEFAQPGTRQARDLDDLIGYLVTAMDKTAI